MWRCMDDQQCCASAAWVAYEQPNEIYVQLCCKDSEKKPYSIPESLGMKQDKNVLSLQRAKVEQSFDLPFPKVWE